MGRSQRLVLAVVGLVGLVAWYAHGLALDAQLMQRLQDAVVSGPIPVFWALRLGWPLVVVALACVALLQTIGDRPVRGWFIAVLLVLLAPFVLSGLPPRLLINLPYYLLSALYLMLALSVGSPRKEGATGRPSQTQEGLSGRLS
jgi:hypothetical protein